MEALRPDHGAGAPRHRRRAVHLGPHRDRVARPRLRRGDGGPGRHPHGARGDRDRSGPLRRRGGGRLGAAPDRHRVMGAPGRGLRGARPRPHGGHEPAHAAADQPTRERDHPGAAADGRAPRAGWADGQLRPPGLLELSVEPPGRAGPQHHPGVALGVRLCVHRERQLRVGDAHSRAGRPGHRPAGLGDTRPAGPPRDRDGTRVLPRAAPIDAALHRRHPTGAREHHIGPRPAPRLRRGVQPDRLPLLSRAPAGPALGPDRLVVLRRVAPARLRHPRPQPRRQPGHHGALRVVVCGRVDALGAPSCP